MPKPTRCPTCDTRVKVPEDADPETEVTCPACDARFVPPHLRADRAADDYDRNDFRARTADGKKPPREREDGHGVDRRRKKRRADDGPKSPFRVIWDNPALVALVGLAVVFFLVVLTGVVISKLGIQVPKGLLGFCAFVVIGGLVMMKFAFLMSRVNSR
jgi:hypothetical protein